MIRQARAFCGIAVGLLIWTNGYGLDALGKYQTYATMPCGNYAEYRASPDSIQVTTFVKGYLSALNFSLDDTYDLLGNTTFEDAMAWIDRYCQEHATATFNDALQMFLVEFYPSRRRSTPE
ncbi:MAG: hypothetical protein L0Y67_01795 [Gammaproteobacteria bacterium]|nr:hypothetical protein [Gammaproteobacteria bacterium]MCI0590332.1 hypothetical protein [Gammaproteobacteria bacterium]